MRARVVLGGFAFPVLGAIAIAACVDSADSGMDAGDAGGGDAFVLFEAGACDAPAYNQLGCACSPPGTPRECNQGVPGPKSACMKVGLQQCGPDRKWGGCVGGDMPDAEVCFDGIDNDCNGKIDQGCKCTDDVDLCKLPDGGTLSPTGYNIVLDPPAPKANQPFNLIIVTKQAAGTPRSLALAIKGCMCQNPGCFGQTEAACSGAGAGCTGWAAVRWRITLPQNTYTADLTTNDPSGACTGTAHALPEFTVGP